MSAAKGLRTPAPRDAVLSAVLCLPFVFLITASTIPVYHRQEEGAFCHMERKRDGR